MLLHGKKLLLLIFLIASLKLRSFLKIAGIIVLMLEKCQMNNNNIECVINEAQGGEDGAHWSEDELFASTIGKSLFTL